MAVAEQADGMPISIHALLAEGDMRHSNLPLDAWDFYPRPPCGGRPSPQNTPSYWDTISIHALLAEGDGTMHYMGVYEQEFLSTPSLRRATGKIDTDGGVGKFLSTPSLRRATLQQ